MRRAVGTTGVLVMVLAMGPVLAPAAGARTTAEFQWTVKYTFGVPASKSCDNFQCGGGSLAGFGDATSTVELTSVSGPIAGTSCFIVTADEKIMVTSDGSTLRLEENFTACLPGNSIQAPDPLPVDAGGTFTVRHGTGVFQGANGSGTFECTMAAGDQQHCTFSGTLTLP